MRGHAEGLYDICAGLPANLSFLEAGLQHPLWVARGVPRAGCGGQAQIIEFLALCNMLAVPEA